MASDNDKDTFLFPGPDQVEIEPLVLSSERALVVDDDPYITEVVATVLGRLGFEVDTVGSALEAMQVYNVKHHEVLISDWKMPGMNGIELVTHLKQIDPNLAAILMTGYGTKETIIEAFTRGRINYFLSKPFKLNDLMEVVSAALKERRIRLSDLEFQTRLEEEIKRATQELEKKNQLLQQKQFESDHLYRELQSRQEEVEGTKNYLEDLLESSVDAIISVDAQRIIGYFSRGAEEMFGFSGGEVIGCPIDLLYPLGRSDLDRLIDELAAKTRVKHFETEMVHRSGKRIITDISASRLRSGLKDSGFLMIIKDIAERKRLEEELRTSNIVLEKLSITDGLTNLFNHRHFQKCLNEEFQRAKRYRALLTLIMLDLDDFKLVNDRYGHQIGDQVLRILAEMIRESVREVDTPARYGGEEFAVILPQTDVDNAVMVAERLKNAIEHSARFQAIVPGLTITASIGLAGYPDPGMTSPQDLIRYADKALYRAKHIGKNRMVVGSSAGETPLGRGESLTHAEKKVILRRIANTLRSTLDLKEILAYLLKEISEALRGPEINPYCAILLMDKNHGLRLEAEVNPEPGRADDFQIAARLSLEKRGAQIFREDEDHGPTTALPIMVEWPDRGEEVVGIIAIGTTPPDLDFFRDLTNQAALGIVNAKLYHEVEISRAAMEKKVNLLMTLSLMDMGLQRNALLYDDFQMENNKLLARCLARIGYDQVLVYEYNPEMKRLHSGVDCSLKGNIVHHRISLAGLPETSRLIRPLNQKATQFIPQVTFIEVKSLSPEEKKLLRPLKLKAKRIILANLLQKDQPKALVIGSKEDIQEEDGEALAMFVLHASIIMENLNLTRMFQDKTNRLTLIHDIGIKLSTAATPEASEQAISHALDLLAEVLQVDEISVYSYHSEDESFDLLAYSSNSAGPGHEPVVHANKRQCPIMWLVAQKASAMGRFEPFLLNDLRHNLRKRLKKRFATNSYLGLPLLFGGHLLGIMNLTDKRDQTGFTKEDAELAEITTGMLATALSDQALMKRLHEQTLQTIEGLVSGLTPSDPRWARNRISRMVELAADLAGIIGLPSSKIAQVRNTALSHAFSVLSSRDNGLPLTDPRKASAQAMIEWLKKLDTLFADLSLPMEIGRPESTTETTCTPDQIIAVAEAFDARYFARGSAQPHDVDQILWDFLTLSPTEFDPQVVEALWRGLWNGRIKFGRRPVMISPEVKSTLINRLNQEVRRRRKSAIPAKSAKEYLAKFTL